MIDVAKCTCLKGCQNCGIPQSQMSNCPAWDPCPLGADVQPGCPEHDRQADR